MADARTRTIVYALCAVASAVLVAHSLEWNFVTDDAFISFVYSRNLADHGQLVFNLGEHVEGYTNFSWTLILAVFYKLGLPPEVMSRVLGTAAGCATLFVCARLCEVVRGDGKASWWDALPAFVLAGIPGYACWSSGGLETQLFTLLSTLAMTLYLRGHLADREPSRGSAIAFGLAALTRPEGVLFFALTGLHRLLRKLSHIDRKRSALSGQLAPTRNELAWVGIFLAFVVPHFLWRRWYYGWWLPNTFYIKSSGIGGVWQQGGYYLQRVVLQFHLWMVPLLVLAGLIAKRPRGFVALVVYATIITSVFLIYVASVGGDFMGLYRFVMPVMPLVVVSACVGLRIAVTRDERAASPAFAIVLVAALLLAHAWHASVVDKQSFIIGADHGIDSPGFLRWYTADRAAIGKWFYQYKKPDDYASVGGAGAQVWYSQIPSLDCFGLSDAHIAHDVKPVSSRPGHQKYAPIEYELSKHPTIITSAYYKLGRYDPPPWEAKLWAGRGYHYVTVEVPGLSSRWYSFLLRNDRRLGPVGPPSAGDEREP